MKAKRLLKILDFSLLFLIFIFGFWIYSLAQEDKKPEPIIVNGDTVEYSTETNEVIAVGNIEVNYKGAKLSCRKLTLNTETKEAVAEENAKLDDERGTIEGAKLLYNFQTRTGTIIDAGFRVNPYFGRAKKLEKASDAEFIVRRGYATTCSLDHPHYRIGAKQINIFPNDKMQTREDAFYLGNVPLLYIPQYNRSLKDTQMHVQVSPGSRKDWGAYLLSVYRYNLAENINGRVYLDYRSKLGIAEGFGFNYANPNFGKGDYKFYYTNEKPGSVPAGKPKEYERYFLRWRHKWEIDMRTFLISEVYKITDKKRKLLDSNHNILKDYFFREYEKDSQPLSYALFHHSFGYSSVDFLLQKRTNNWYDQLDKLPEVKYTLPSLQLGESPFYFENATSFANYNKKASTSPVTSDNVSVVRLDTTNKFFLPKRVAFLQISPYVSSRQTFYDRSASDKTLPIRSIFYSGLDVSTKFYRIQDVKSNFLGLEISGLRHIITPTIGYAYNHEPTVVSRKLKQIDSVDSITRNNSLALELSNKLQTKRKGQSVDLVDFRVTTSYIFKPKAAVKSGSSFSDFLFKLKLLPYSWLRLEADATYNRSTSSSDPSYNRFTDVNYDINFNPGKGYTFGIGQRYQRSGGNELTSSFRWNLNPKWKLAAYLRYNTKQYLDAQNQEVPSGFTEQEYTVSRNLHCWDIDVTFNTKKNEGSTIWFIFRLKAFPEMEFGFNQSYHEPNSGSQSNP